MEEQLYPEEKKEAQNTNSKFVKTSQVSKAKELERIVPKWTIEDVIKDMARVAKRSDLSQVDKQQTMINILSNYEKLIAPLSNFLNKNGIQYK
jgi:arginine deiminase